MPRLTKNTGVTLVAIVTLGLGTKSAIRNSKS